MRKNSKIFSPIVEIAAVWLYLIEIIFITYEVNFYEYG